MATPDLNAQLAAIFDAGLRADPSLRDSLAEALARDEAYTKAEVNYRKAGDDGQSDTRCGTCSYFIGGSSGEGSGGNGSASVSANGACDIVAGSIRASDVCDKYDNYDKGKGTDTRK